MTIKSALATAKEKLRAKKINNYSWEAEELLSFAIDKERSFLLSHPEIVLDRSQKTTYNNLIKQRSKYVPFAYLVGCQYFYGYKFKVNKHVLVPRPESELIINELEQLLEDNVKTKLIDLGTGSGCLAISAAKEYSDKLQKILALDISYSALRVARYNAKSLGVKINFQKSDLLKTPLRKKFFSDDQKIIILANLPYVPNRTKPNHPNNLGLAYEPSRALYSGPDGLDDYRRLAEQVKSLEPKPELTLICEANPDQMTELQHIFDFAKKKIIKKDLSGKDRILILSFN